MGKTFHHTQFDDDETDTRRDKFSDRRKKRLRTITNKQSSIEEKIDDEKK